MSIDNMSGVFAKGADRLNVEFAPGAKVVGTVVLIDRKSVFLDINAKSEGIINREELTDKEGNLKVKVGDKVEAFYVDNAKGEITLTIKMSGQIVSQHLDEARENGIPVVGKVIAERKGGFSVKVAGQEAFCPYSQIDIRNRAAEEYIGNEFSFLIQDLSPFNMVVSRRKLLDAERAAKLKELREKLQVGDIVEGEISNVKDFGAFVDLGGCDGFIPISELSWSRSEKTEDVVTVGLKVRVEVKSLDWDNRKITLSFRSAQSPWEHIMDQYPVGRSVPVTITRLEAYGAFAMIEKGLEGLLHISKLGGGKRIRHPQEVLKVGDKVQAKIESYDEERHRIALALDLSGDVEAPAEKEESEEGQIINLAQGVRLTGTVDGVREFGVFVRLNPEKSGLLHVSEVSKDSQTRLTLKNLMDRFPNGSKVDVVIKDIQDSGKISLALPSAEDEGDARVWQDNRDQGPNNFGSLSDVFGKLGL